MKTRLQRTIAKSQRLIDQGLDQAAARVATRALAKYPTSADLHLMRALALVEASPDQAVQELRKAVEGVSLDPVTWVRVASMLLPTGELTEARLCLDRARSLSARRGLIAMADTIEGQLEIAAGDLAAGEALLRGSFESDPTCGTYLAPLIRFLVWNDRADEARALLDTHEHSLVPEPVAFRQLLRGLDI